MIFSFLLFNIYKYDELLYFYYNLLMTTIPVARFGITRTSSIVITGTCFGSVRAVWRSFSSVVTHRADIFALWAKLCQRTVHVAHAPRSAVLSLVDPGRMNARWYVTERGTCCNMPRANDAPSNTMGMPEAAACATTSVRTLSRKP